MKLCPYKLLSPLDQRGAYRAHSLVDGCCERAKMRSTTIKIIKIFYVMNCNKCFSSRASLLCCIDMFSTLPVKLLSICIFWIRIGLDSWI